MKKYYKTKFVYLIAIANDIKKSKEENKPSIFCSKIGNNA